MNFGKFGKEMEPRGKRVSNYNKKLNFKII